MLLSAANDAGRARVWVIPADCLIPIFREFTNPAVVFATAGYINDAEFVAHGSGNFLRPVITGPRDCELSDRAARIVPQINVRACSHALWYDARRNGALAQD